MRKWIGVLFCLLLIVSTGCEMPQNHFAGADNEVKLITFDPGHFHAALVQKTMYDQVSPTVHVYAPEGPDVADHLNRIEGFNTRTENPTRWEEIVYTGPDYLDKMIAERKGNVVVISGNNAKKTDCIERCILSGFNVLADKPMVISPEKFPLLVKAFQDAQWRSLLLCDLMTERYEITTILQKELAQIPAVFGELQKGTLENPAVTKESVHHFFKYVAGNANKHPAWSFDPNQQGEGLVDVSTHLVDLIQWECFPEQILNYKTDIQMLNAKRWTTTMSPEQFYKVTGLETYPDYLIPSVTDGQLAVYSNGEMNYTIKGVHAKVSVTWNFEAPTGTGDTHYSIMRGTKASLIIRQDAEENYKPVLYVEANDGAHIDNTIHRAVYKTLQKTYPGITMTFLEEGKWRINIPQKYHVGHETRFIQDTEKYLQYLAEGKLPAWEVPNMIAKYYTTTEALKVRKNQNNGTFAALYSLVYCVRVFGGIHEAAHAFAGYWFGDHTAMHHGLTTLNPVPHIPRSPIGMIVVPLLSFVSGGWMIGWASTPYDPYWAQRYPKEAAFMSLAGPAANLILVIIASLLIHVGISAGIFHPPESIIFTRVVEASQDGFLKGLAVLVSILFTLNVILLVFNLIPVPPLDGTAIGEFIFKGETLYRYRQFMSHPSLRIFGIFIAWMIMDVIYDPIHTFALNALYIWRGLHYG